MSIEISSIPDSTRVPGVYIEFNTELAVRTLPSNAQRVLLAVPLDSSATVDPNTPVQVYSDTEAANFGDVAKKMAAAAITANRYLDLSLVGVTVDGDKPDIAAALAASAGGEYNLVATAWSTESVLMQLRDHIERYTDAIEQQSILGVAGSTDTLAKATTLAGNLNSGAITLALLPGSDSTDAEIAAAYAAVIASESDPARPLNTLELKGIEVPPIDARLGRQEKETALANGVTPLEVGPGNRVQIVRAISTYTTSANGADDVSLLDITTMRTLYYTRQACRERIRLRFPRAKLSDRQVPAVRSELLDVLKNLDELEILENVDDNADGLIVERSATDASRLNARIPADVVNGLHVFAGRIDLIL